MAPPDAGTSSEGSASAPDVPMLDIGEELDGRYRIVEHLATGGFGHVHAAHDLREDRRVAIKILRTDSAARDPRAAARMRQEAEILRALAHPNLVTVYDVVTRQAGDYMVMELLEGRTLDVVIEEDGPAPPERVRPAAAQILSALGALHDRGVNHRDIKPANIMLLPDDSREERAEIAKLVDFGIAKAQEFLDDDHEEAGFTLVETQGDGFVGTPRYASPEQAVGDPTVPSSDLFSLGLVLYEWFTGEPVIDGTRRKGIISLLIQPDPIDVSDCPDAWQAWMGRMLAKTPQERFATAEEALENLPGDGDIPTASSPDAATPREANDGTAPMQSQPTASADVRPEAADSGPVPSDKMKTRLYQAEPEPADGSREAPAASSSELELAEPLDPGPPVELGPGARRSAADASTEAPTNEVSREQARRAAGVNTPPPGGDMASGPAENPRSPEETAQDSEDELDALSIILTVLAALFFAVALWIFLTTVVL